MTIANDETIIKEELIMKTKNNFNGHFKIMILTITAGVSLLLYSCTSQELDNKVQQAYELRMKGNADSAKALLEEIIDEDSTNAMAWYELARTKHHIGLGNPRELLGSLEDIQFTIEKSVKYDTANVIYSFYKGIISYTRAYVSLMRGNPDAEEKVKEVISAFESVLSLKPDYYEARLYLVEVLSIPVNMGGDSLKADTYAKQLEKIDEMYGAKARELLLPEDVDRIEFWKKIKENHANDADVHEALGKAYLYKNNIDEASKCFEKAISLDSTKNNLHVDIGRYYLMQAMQNRVQLDSVAYLIENAFEIYLNSKPEPINPLKAFVIGKLASVKFRIGDKENGNKLQVEANTLDPNYSKAFATPSQILFNSPDAISRVHVYFTRPF